MDTGSSCKTAHSNSIPEPGHIRRARADERLGLLALWECSVRATHTFLAEADIDFYRPLTAEILRGNALDLWVITDNADRPLGFLGMVGQAVEALFLEPSYRRQGAGRRLIDHAQCLSGGALTVEVNEQNLDALRFYQALGFQIVSRSACDPMGRPFPLLHLRRLPPETLQR
jgi:putative acetyltransferase